MKLDCADDPVAKISTITNVTRMGIFEFRELTAFFFQTSLQSKTFKCLFLLHIRLQSESLCHFVSVNFSN